MIEVDGIILVLSCQKHLNTRLKEFRLPNDNYGNWKVIYVIGDLFLDSDYKIEKNFMTVKCEDSYIHLLKKLVLSLKYLYEIYDIKEGVLRCGDDLMFNEDMLITFLQSSNKFDYIGKSHHKRDVYVEDITPELLKKTIDDRFMVDYYLTHQEDFNNLQHNLNNVDISKYVIRPQVLGAVGIIYYISNKCCKILIDHLEKINYNIFHFDDFSQSYPYTIEDCAVTYMLYSNKIGFNNNNKMYTSNLLSRDAIALHTNKYK